MSKESKKPNQSGGILSHPYASKALIGIGALVVLVLITLTWSNWLGDGNGDTPVAESQPVDIANITELSRETKEMLDGTIEEAPFLGAIDAPVTLIEFADLNCAPCADFHRDVLPMLIADYVKPGKLRIDLELLGPDPESGSIQAAEVASMMAVGQNYWGFADLYMRDQDSGQGTDPSNEYLAAIASQFEPLAASDIDAVGEDPLVIRDRVRADSMATEWEVDVASLPAFLLGPSIGPMSKLDVDPTDPQALADAIDAALLSAGGA